MKEWRRVSRNDLCIGLKVKNADGELGTIINVSILEDVVLKFDKGGAALVCFAGNEKEIEKLWMKRR